MAAGDFFIGQPEKLLGFPPGGGGTQRLARLVGRDRALKLMLDGAGIDPEAAARIGYVDEVVPPAELLDRAVALADRLGQRMKPVVAAVKRAAYIGGSRGLDEGLHVERSEFLSTLASKGAQAAMIAYIGQTEATGRPTAVRPADIRADAGGRALRTSVGPAQQQRQLATAAIAPGPGAANPPLATAAPVPVATAAVDLVCSRVTLASPPW